MTRDHPDPARVRSLIVLVVAVMVLSSLTPALYPADAVPPPLGGAAKAPLRTSVGYGVSPHAGASWQGPLPPPPSNITVVPGSANVTLAWNGTGTQATGFVVVWGVEGAPTSNLTVNATRSAVTLAPLLAYVPYAITVASDNASGIGNASAPVQVVLSPWTLVKGSVSPVNATVTVDDVLVPAVAGTFALNTSYLPHVIAATLADYASGAITADPVWNGTVWANLTLHQLPGTIEGYLTPAIANLSFNGGLIVVNGAGFFEFSIAPDTPGTLSASYPGLLSQNVTVSAPANRTVWVNITLVPPNGTLRLSVAPSDASVWVDGVLIGLNASGGSTLSRAPGLYAIEVTRAGYHPNFQNATVRSGEVTAVAVDLVLVANDTHHNDTGSSGGLSVGDPVTAGLIVGVVIAGVVVAALALRERRRPPAVLPPVSPTDAGVLEAEIVGPDRPSP